MAPSRRNENSRNAHDPKRRKDHIFHGLKLEFIREIVSHVLSSYEEIISCVDKISKEFTESYGFEGKQEKKRMEERKMDKGKREKKNFPICGNCGKKHPGTCLKGMGVCYKCGGKGHKVRDCKGKKMVSNVQCFICKEFGHYANLCPSHQTMPQMMLLDNNQVMILPQMKRND